MPQFLSDPFDSRPFTFAAPDDGEPFSALLAADAATRAGEPSPDELEVSMAAMRRAISAAERQARLVSAFNGSQESMAEAADHRIETVRRATGVQLENPFRQGYHMAAQRRVDDARARGEEIGPRGPRVLEEQRRIFTEKIDEVAQNFPDKAAALQFFQPLEDQATAIAGGAAYDGEHVPTALVPSLIGGIYGARRDPLFVLSFFAGPGLQTGGTVASRVGWSALKQGLYNMGLSALAQPSVQDWRRQIGARHGIVPAAEEVGLSFALGAIPGAGIQGAVEAARGSLTPIERVIMGAARKGDVEAAARALGVEIDNLTSRTIRMGEAQDAATRAAVGDPPPGIAAQDHTDLAAQSIRHAEDPRHQPPPELAIVAPPRPPGQVHIIDEAQAVALGARETVDGKPVTFQRFDPRGLQTDAATFQYKGGGDIAGVTDRLRHVTAWDPLASGKTIVWERADGTQFIADGHQRLALARRAGTPETRIDGFLLREADGWTPPDVRALAAKKNMQEGAGDALDAARVLRERPDLLDSSMPVSTPMMKNAVALARLSDEAFGMALNGVAPPNYAAAVGAMVPDRLQHAAVLADLARFQPETEREARVLIGEIMASGFRAEEQISLFGATAATRSMMGERVKVLDAALQGLVRDKKLFGTLADKADAIEAAGNQLARGVNETRARDAAALSDMLTRLAQRTGPVSDALNRAAARMAGGEKAAKAADAFLDEVRALLDRDGLSGLLATPELRPRAVFEPGTAEATHGAEGALASRMDSPVSPRREAATPLPVSEQPHQRAVLSHGEAADALDQFKSGQAGTDLEALYPRARELQKQIGQAGRQIAAELGIEFRDPGVKSLATAREKIARKGYENAGDITDLARGAFLAHAPEQADRIAARLAERFDVFDEGWKVSRGGYLDRKMLVRGGDGTIGEIQIVSREMYQAKRGGGQDIYDRFRNLPEGPELDALLEKSRALYAEAAARSGTDWSGIMERSRGPNFGSNVARQASSDMSPAVKTTSASSTFDHGAPGLSTAQARAPRTNTAGRQSQLQNSMETSSAENIGASRAPDKTSGEPSLFEAVAVSDRADGRDARLVSHAAALEGADKTAFHADLVGACKQ